jgi:hypothetical protein
MVRKAFSICVIVFSTITANAGSGGSSYSLFGIGDIRYLPNARSAGMGYTGLGLPSANSINTLQPAAWARISRVRVDAGLLYEGYKSSDGNKSLYLANSNFSGALLAIPISVDHGIVSVLGFTPYSNVNYNLFLQGKQEGIEHQINYSGTGGVSRGLLGLSYSPLPDLSFGASFNYLFGSIDNVSTFSPLNTPSSTESYGGGVTTTTLTLHGITTSIGGVFNGFGRISESLTPFSLGFVVTSRANMKTDRETRYDFLAERDTVSAVKERLTIPVAYGVGLAYQPSERYLLAADYYAQTWGDATFNGVDPPEVRNSFRVGIGGERLPERDASGWFSRLVYRVGFHYHSTYYNINGTPINEWVVTGGVAIPLFGDARFNTAFEYGSRGTTDNGLVKDRIFRMTFSLSLSEPWFQRYEEE